MLYFFLHCRRSTKREVLKGGFSGNIVKSLNGQLMSIVIHMYLKSFVDENPVLRGKRVLIC